MVARLEDEAGRFEHRSKNCCSLMEKVRLSHAGRVAARALECKRPRPRRLHGRIEISQDLAGPLAGFVEGDRTGYDLSLGDALLVWPALAANRSRVPFPPRPRRVRELKSTSFSGGSVVRSASGTLLQRI